MPSTIEKDMKATSVAIAELSSQEVETTPHHIKRQNMHKSKNTMCISVLLVDDHTLMRAGLRQLLSLEKDIAVIGEAGDGFAAMQQVRQLRPTVVLLDINMPGIDGITLTRQITCEFPDIAVIILSMHSDQQYVAQALKNGAKGYLLKTCSMDEVTDTVRNVSTGATCTAPECTAVLGNAYQRSSSVQFTENSDPIALLTEKEQEIVRNLAHGMSNREIADKLAYSEKTVKNYLSTIFQKLNIRDRTQAAILALQQGILDT